MYPRLRRMKAKQFKKNVERLRNGRMQRRELFKELLEHRYLAGQARSGRFEGTVKRDTDDATFLRAITLGSIDGNRQAIEIYEQIGGELPAAPQYQGEAFVLWNNLLFFAVSDSVGQRRYLSLIVGDALLSFSRSIFDDDREPFTFSGVLRPV